MAEDAPKRTSKAAFGLAVFLTFGWLIGGAAVALGFGIASIGLSTVGHAVAVAGVIVFLLWVVASM